MSRGQRGSGRSYISIFEGTFEQRVKEPREGSVQRTTSKGKTINVVQFDTFTGFVESIEFDLQNEYGPKVSIIAKDSKETLCIQMNVNSGYSMDLMMRLKNVDLSKEVTLNPVYFEEDGKKKSFFAMSQNGNKVERFITKDTPGLPAWEKNEDPLTGKVTWDKSKTVAFLVACTKKIAEELENSLPVSESGNSTEPLPSPGVTHPLPTPEEADDDLPF